jgi:parvulin-like peptidyl-prolyl isomerase
MRKLVPSLALVAVAAIALAGCDLHVGPYAAIVDGKTISQQTLQDAVSSAAADSSYVCSITSNYQAQIRTHGIGSETYDAQFTDFVLSTLVRAQLAADKAASRNLQVTSMLRPVAMAQISGSLGSTSGCSGTAAKTFGDLSPALQSAYLTLYENLDLLGAAQDGVTLTTAGLDQYASSHPTAGNLVCLSYIQVSTRQAAEQAEKALGKGTSFDAEASKVSSATSDSVGCPPVTQLPAQIASAVGKLPVGKWTAPVSFQNQYLILEVTSRRAANPTELVQLVLTNAEQHFSSLLGSLDQSKSVQVDPAYGTWAAASGTGAPIAAPTAPPDGFLPAPQSVQSPFVTSPSPAPATSPAG